MSKISSATLSAAVEKVLKFSAEKKRGFLETVELQIALKNYDPKKDKRFSGTITLPETPRPRMTVCVLGNAKHIDECKAAGIPCRSVEDLQSLNKNKKLVKKLAQEFHAFLASANLIRKIPRLLGPGLNKAGKFPTVLGNNDDVTEKVDQIKKTIKFQLKSKKTLCLSVPIANVGMDQAAIERNILMSVNFLVGLLKKNWQNIRRLYIKSTMGPVSKIYGF